MSSPNESDRRPLGAVHGRFQPFHNGHLGYLLEALDRFSTVIVGITNPFPSGSYRDEATDPHRHRPENNPYDLFERVDMIALSCSQLRTPVLDRVRVVPFDVTGPRWLWPNTIPLGAVQVVVPHEPWDEEKARRFSDFGYSVEFLETTPDRLSATRVRSLIRAGDPSWESLVPAGTASVIGRPALLQRLQGAASQ